MDCKLMINDFEGPMDLLLHLIKKSDIDIYDINIEDVTKQYLDFINEMEELNLNIASEYLVMATELLEMKSRLLLPSNKEDLEDEYEEDSKEKLIKRLLDYKNYKDITSTFKDLEHDRSLIFTKLPSDISEYKIPGSNEETHSVSLLLDAFSKFLERNKLQQPLHTKITSKEMSINERINSIRKTLHTKKEITFDELFEVYTKEFLVVTFLAVLQMVKEQEIIIEQNNIFDQIHIKLKGRA